MIFKMTNILILILLLPIDTLHRNEGYEIDKIVSYRRQFENTKANETFSFVNVKKENREKYESKEKNRSVRRQSRASDLSNLKNTTLQGTSDVDTGWKVGGRVAKDRR